MNIIHLNKRIIPSNETKSIPTIDIDEEDIPF